jgi:nucleotide-binding universal stress UspA family protein
MLTMPFEYSDPAHREHAWSLLAAAAEEAAGSHPAVDLRPGLLEGPTVATLCRLSETARLVVLGSRGLGGIAGLFVGSIGVAVAARAHCPVVVLRESVPGGGPVAVGDSAQAHSGRVRVRRGRRPRRRPRRRTAWTPPSTAWRSDVRPLTHDAAELESAEWHAFKEAIVQVAEKHPSVAVTTRLIAGDVRHVLTEASTGAQLMVVGSRGRGGLAGLILGSVSNYLLHHGHCPIAVIPPHTESA